MLAQNLADEKLIALVKLSDVSSSPERNFQYFIVRALRTIRHNYTTRHLGLGDEGKISSDTQ